LTKSHLNWYDSSGGFGGGADLASLLPPKRSVEYIANVCARHCSLFLAFTGAETEFDSVSIV